MDIHNINFILRPFSEKLGIIFCIRERADVRWWFTDQQYTLAQIWRFPYFNPFFSTYHQLYTSYRWDKHLTKRYQPENGFNLRQKKNCVLCASMKLVRKNITNLSVTLMQKKKRCKCHIKAKKGKWSQFWFWNCFYYTPVYDTQKFNNRKNLWLSQLWLKPLTTF